MKSSAPTSWFQKKCPYCAAELQVSEWEGGAWALCACPACEKTSVIETQQGRKIPGFGPPEGAIQKRKPRALSGSQSPAQAHGQATLEITTHATSGPTLQVAPAPVDSPRSAAVPPPPPVAAAAQNQRLAEAEPLLTLEAPAEEMGEDMEPPSDQAPERFATSWDAKRVLDPLARFTMAVLVFGACGLLLRASIRSLRGAISQELSTFEQGYEQNRTDALARAPEPGADFSSGARVASPNLPLLVKSPDDVKRAQPAQPSPPAAAGAALARGAEPGGVVPLAEARTERPRPASVEEETPRRSRRTRVASRGHGEAASRSVRVVASFAVLRSGPGREFHKVGLARSELRLMVRGSMNNWFEVETASGSAWIRGDLVKPAGTVARREEEDSRQ